MLSWVLKAFILLTLPLASFASGSGGGSNSCFYFYRPKIYTDKTTYGLQAFKLNIDRLKVHFQKTKSMTDDEKVNLLLTSDARVVFFRLQSLAKIYEKAYERKFFTKQRGFFKKYEDLIGRVDLYQGLIGVSTKLKQPRLIKYFENKKSEAATNLLNGLIEARLARDPNDPTSNVDPVDTLNEVYEHLAKFEDWKSAEKDLEMNLKNIVSYARSLLTKIKAREFTQDDIELGLHDLRRGLRWPLIHIQTLNRLTAYDVRSDLPKDVQSYFESMQARNPKILKSGFLSMKAPDIKHPMRVPLYPYAMLTDIVAEIGTKKDGAESDIYITQAMQELGFAQRTQAKVQKDLLKMTNRTEIVDHKSLAEQYQADIDASGLLEYFANQLEKLNDIDN
tara:strand:+ start:15593 stop:16768 length:1176 start_codon:yes stop_codon:yes gene_type:complete